MTEPDDRDLRIIAEQLGRTPRGVHANANRTHEGVTPEV